MKLNVVRNLKFSCTDVQVHSIDEKAIGIEGQKYTFEHDIVGLEINALIVNFFKTTQIC